MMTSSWSANGAHCWTLRSRTLSICFRFFAQIASLYLHNPVQLIVLPVRLRIMNTVCCLLTFMCPHVWEESLVYINVYVHVTHRFQGQTDNLWLHHPHSLQLLYNLWYRLLCIQVVLGCWLRLCVACSLLSPVFWVHIQLSGDEDGTHCQHGWGLTCIQCTGSMGVGVGGGCVDKRNGDTETLRKQMLK